MVTNEVPRMDADLSTWINDLAAADAQLRVAAAEQLSRAANARAAAVALVRASDDPDEQVRELAASALEDMGSPAIDDVAALAALLEPPTREAAYWAATLLGRCGEAAAPAVGSLAGLLSNPHAAAAARQRAAWALGEIGPAAAEARAALEQAIGGNDPRLSRLSAAALAKLSR